MLSYSILICAFNEEKNIESLLNSMYNEVETFSAGFTLDNVLVVSDSSTDATDRIVQCFSDAKWPRLKLLRTPHRSGKAGAFNFGKKGLSSDYLISIDADVAVEAGAFGKLLQYGFDQKADLIAARAIVDSSCELTFATRAARGSNHVLAEISRKYPRSLLASRGCLMLLSKKLYQNVELPNTPGTDQYLYLYAKKQALVFDYDKRTLVKYRPPQVFRDYLRQNHRHADAISIRKAEFGTKFVADALRIRLVDKVIAVALTGFRYPLDTVAWFIFFCTAVMLSLTKKHNSGGVWEIASSTK